MVQFTDGSGKMELVLLPHTLSRQASYLSSTRSNSHCLIVYHHFPTFIFYLKTKYSLYSTCIMPERRQVPSTSAHSRPTGVRRNLFHQHLSRRPTTSSTSTSAETLRLDSDHGSETADIVIRDKNGDFDIGDPPMPPMDDPGEGAHVEAQEDESSFVQKQGGHQAN
jgi:hypothetical protein